jgi:hypothetical protein
MDSEGNALLRRLLEVSEENNKILKGMRRSARYRTVFAILYWIVAAGLFAAAYYYIEPYITQLWDVYRAAADIIPH